jgi:hypothetical protein
MPDGYYPIIVGSIALAYSLYCLAKLISVRNWPSAEGKIIASSKTARSTDAGKMQDAEIAYEYTVAGKRYTARVIQAGGDMSSANSKKETDVDKKLAKYPIGTVVNVYYNPRFPQMACLERSDATAVFIGLVFGPLAILVGYLFL